MKKTRVVFVGALVVTALLSSTAAIASRGHDDRTNDVRRAIDGGTAKNVIMFLGDGMGDSEITIARNYAVGAAGHLAMDSLPLTVPTPPTRSRKARRTSRIT